MSGGSIDIGSLGRDERSALLYAECRVVDAHGLMEGVRLNAADIAALKKFQDMGFLTFGRIPFKTIEQLTASNGIKPTHWVKFNDEAWALAHRLRRFVADNRAPGPNRRKVNEALAAEALTS